ncbi:MAG TPA: VOC family protein [Candidatus Saccharimonadales bacterium]|nr:VOC family protein [Candidatus Saccharimonadales bacterium]
MNKTRLNPYLSFGGNAREAMEFYKSVFGGELTVSTFGETDPNCPDDIKDQVMHAQLESEDLIVLMASDPAPGGSGAGPNGSLSLSGDNEAQLTEFFTKLSDGGKVVEPLRKQVWGDTFGMCTDKYGVFWMINITTR